MRAADLRKSGLRDFISFDRPDTDDPVKVAADAFLCAAIDSRQEYVCDSRIIESCIAFLETEIQKAPTVEALHTLKALLDAHPADPAAIRQWFADTYR